jgi:hypothetical protein
MRTRYREALHAPSRQAVAYPDDRKNQQADFRRLRNEEANPPHARRAVQSRQPGRWLRAFSLRGPGLCRRQGRESFLSTSIGLGLLGRRASSLGQPCGFRELLARVDERRDSVRDDLEWAKKNDDDQRSYGALERSDIPDAAEASELFPEKWWGVVIQQGPRGGPCFVFRSQGSIPATLDLARRPSAEAVEA